MNLIPSRKRLVTTGLQAVGLLKRAFATNSSKVESNCVQQFKVCAFQI